MKRAVWIIGLALLTVSFAGNVSPVYADGTLVHLYELSDREDVFGGPRLSLEGGEFSGGRYVFDENEGLRLTGALDDSEDYSICTIVEFDELPETWVKVIDLQDGELDEGLYLHMPRDGTGHLYFYNETDDGPANISPNTNAHIVLVVDEEKGETRGYVNGVLQWTFDTTDVESPAGGLLFFKDDESTEDEESSGSADVIGIYDGPLTQRQITNLANDDSCGEAPDEDEDEQDRFLGGGVVGAFPGATDAARANRERANAAGAAAAASASAPPPAPATVRPPSTGDGGLLP